MKEPKNITLLLIPYLTICGALYHIAYWDTFHLNGLSFISLSDIIKSFAYPITYTLIALLAGAIFTRFVVRIDKALPKGGGRNTPVGKKLNSSVATSIILFVWLITITWLFINGNSNTWIIWGIIVAMPPFIYLTLNTSFLSEEIKDESTRSHIIQLLVNFIILSFATGKYDSAIIKENLKYKYTIQKTTSDTSSHNNKIIKLLGNTEKHFIFSNLNNDSIFMIKSDNIDTLILLDKK